MAEIKLDYVTVTGYSHQFHVHRRDLATTSRTWRTFATASLVTSFGGKATRRHLVAEPEPAPALQ